MCLSDHRIFCNEIFKIYFQSSFVSRFSLVTYLFLSFPNFVWLKHHFDLRLGKRGLGCVVESE